MAASPRAPMAPPFRLTFPRTSSSAYQEAVRLAKQSPGYAEAQDGRQLVHTATFGAIHDELATLTEFGPWSAAGRAPASRWTVSASFPASGPALVRS